MIKFIQGSPSFSNHYFFQFPKNKNEKKKIPTHPSKLYMSVLVVNIQFHAVYIQEMWIEEKKHKKGLFY